MKRLAFLICSLFFVAYGDENQLQDCKQVIYDSMSKNLEKIIPTQNFFDRVDELPLKMKEYLHFGRIQKIDGVIYAEFYDQDNIDAVKKMETYANFLNSHNQEIGDLDIVVTLYDENRPFVNVAYNKLFYSGPIFTPHYHEQEKKLFDDEEMFILFPDGYVLETSYRTKIDRLAKISDSVIFDKKIDQAFFRGGNNAGSGIIEQESKLLVMHPRGKIFILSYLFPDYINAKPTHFGWYDLTSEESIKLYRLYQTLFDRPKKNLVDIVDQMKYKYIISLDGVAASWTRPQIISFSGSLLMYQTAYRQWFQDAMQPYVNYIPIRDDLSDLLGQIDWARSNPDKVKQIIKNQEITAKKCFTFAEVENQFLFLLQNYSKKFDYKISNKMFEKYGAKAE